MKLHKFFSLKIRKNKDYYFLKYFHFPAKILDTKHKMEIEKLKVLFQK